jgi:hypothetical protein
MNDEKLDDIEMVNSDDSWNRYKIYVIVTIKRLRTEVDGIRKKIDEDIITKLNYLENQISKLQVKSGAWGLLAGLLGVVIAMIIKSQFEVR